ncbi:MAG: PorV/PorQ family protein [Calditrichaceae bacterium]|nr:PorV/PorQ family protein [Calditrichaceae bacterium]MBN2709206.1 PorV/PorQ family protein [Calditrichaceae bacterium]RQV96161.1 MAG: PorV/PorQ family protein [Calditrichota bacterium]
MRYIVIIVILIFNFASAEDTKYGASFLELGVGARPLGMGGAYVALSGDAPGFYWNPAGLAFQTSFETAFMHADLFKGLETHNYFSASMPILGGATLSIGAVGLFIDDIGRRYLDDSDYSGRLNNIYPKLTNTEGSFSSYDIAGFLTFAKFYKWELDMGWQYNKIPIEAGFGVNIKYINSKIDDKSGSGGGIDLGFITRVGFYEIFQEEFLGNFSLGINLQDIAGTKITWNTDTKHKDKIEHNIKYGIAYAQPLKFISSQITFAYDIDTKYEGGTHLGTEFLFRSTLALRAGAFYGRFTAGAGIYLWKFKVDYAYQSHDLGNCHRVSVLFGM